MVVSGREVALARVYSAKGNETVIPLGYALHSVRECLSCTGQLTSHRRTHIRRQLEGYSLSARGESFISSHLSVCCFQQRVSSPWGDILKRWKRKPRFCPGGLIPLSSCLAQPLPPPPPPPTASKPPSRAIRTATVDPVSTHRSWAPLSPLSKEV
jgi:hypothetical protein